MHVYILTQEQLLLYQHGALVLPFQKQPEHPYKGIYKDVHRGSYRGLDKGVWHDHCQVVSRCRRSWDLGVYVVITSSHPLKVYVYNDIVLRFCQAKYVDPVVEPEVCAHTL